MVRLMKFWKERNNQINVKIKFIETAGILSAVFCLKKQDNNG